MSLLSPWNLLWLLPLLGGIAALWMLRRKRREVVVSSLLLWQGVLPDTQAATPFRRLQRHFLLFLQLLAAFLLVLALARPFVYGRGLTGRTLVIVLDNGASMNATDTRPTRLDAARDAAKDFLRRELGGTDAATILTTSPRPQTMIGLTGDRARLGDALDRAGPTDAPGDLAGALTLAQSLTRGKTGSEIRVFTDGALGPDDAARIAALPFGGTGVRQQAVGSASAFNAAITALDARRNPDTGRTEVFVAVRRFGTGRAGGTLSLLQDGRLVDARALSFQGGADDETFDSALLARGGVVTARLDDVHDDLATDNEASVVLPAQAHRRVLLVSGGNLFLEKALSLDPETTLDECAPGRFGTVGKGGAGYALVVFDGAKPPATFRGNCLVFGAGAGAGRGTTLLAQSRTHPVMRFVDLQGVRVRALSRMATPPGATVLAEGRGGPWIAARESDGRRSVLAAFDLADTDWPLRVSFPIFVANAVEWLAQGGRPGATAAQTPVGSPFSVVVPPGGASLVVSAPDGHDRTVAAPPDGGVVSFADTPHVGVYHVRGGAGVDYPVAVDLLDAAASDLTPRRVAALDHTGAALRAADVPPASRVRQDLWPTVAAVALLVLLLEWVVYQRR